jgi:hypothetical protein
LGCWPLKFPRSQNRQKLDFVKTAPTSGITCPTMPGHHLPTVLPGFGNLGTPPWAWRAPDLGALSAQKRPHDRRHTRTRPNFAKPCGSASSTFFHVMGLLVGDVGASLRGVPVKKCETATLDQPSRVSQIRSRLQPPRPLFDTQLDLPSSFQANLSLYTTFSGTPLQTPPLDKTHHNPPCGVSHRVSQASVSAARARARNTSVTSKPLR